jgi:hypothetical protein
MMFAYIRRARLMLPASSRLSTSRSKTVFIKNDKVPICVNCVYYDSHRDDPWLSKCQKFGDRDIITGDVVYNNAKMCRTYSILCGPDGKFFKRFVPTPSEPIIT